MTLRDVGALFERVRAVAEVAAEHADAVDRDARFPVEAIGAARGAGLLSLLAPTTLGGEGLGYAALSEVVTTLGAACSSTAMVFAMHQIQVACLVRHGGPSPAMSDLLRELVTDQLLFASATSEAGIGGDVRQSSCFLDRGAVGSSLSAAAGRWRLIKDAPVISYGAYADAVFATARLDANSPPSEQVVAICRASELLLEQTSSWDTLGFRGTCSPGYVLTAEGPADLVLPVPYEQISRATMLPVAHLLWSALWLGIATAATKKARQFVQQQARGNPDDIPPGALRLAELLVVHQQLRALVDSAGRDYDERIARDGGTDGFRFAADANTLKVAASGLVVDVVTQALRICGIAGYRDDSPFRLGRLLRDAMGGSVMVANDRILANTAQQQLADRS